MESFWKSSAKYTEKSSSQQRIQDRWRLCKQLQRAGSKLEFKFDLEKRQANKQA